MFKLMGKKKKMASLRSHFTYLDLSSCFIIIIFLISLLIMRIEIKFVIHSHMEDKKRQRNGHIFLSICHGPHWNHSKVEHKQTFCA